jgi:hypothetical protein
MKNAKFWNYFDDQAFPLLKHRAATFKQIFEYLDTLPGSINIVETGCARVIGNWEGDGQSTLLFDKYINERDQDSTCVTVDISEKSVLECRAVVSKRTTVFQQDSVQFLAQLVTKYATENVSIDLLYLDSYDVDWNYWYPSAIHHLKELTAALRALNSQTLVVVDDCPATSDFIYNKKNNIIDFRTTPRVGGKGRLIAELAQAIGAKCLFAEYQAGWINMVPGFSTKENITA